jgi:4-amino-4-deoxy-L-arabinose transferase-like glycosyltransferase
MVYRLDARRSVVTETFMKIPRWQWLAIMLVAGIAARLLWVAMTVISLRSDGMTYYTLARGLFEHGGYGNQANGRAQWPPGLPFFYYGFFVLFGEHYWIPLVGNLLLYAITLFCVFATGADILDERAARLATLVVTIWPNFILSAGGASKELLLAALLAATILFFVKSWRDPTPATVIGMSALSGLMLGMASLAQPSMLLFPAAMAVAIRAQCVQFRPLALRLAVIMLAMAAVIAPWSMRNYSVLKEFVAISTNGGDVFYRANNPLATGGYVQRGEKDLDALGLGEVERSRMGYELGKTWIRQNPGAFSRWQ